MSAKIIVFKPKKRAANKTANNLPETDRPFDGNEAKSIFALLCHVAYMQNVKLGHVEKMVKEHFGVTAIEEIRAADFDNAMRFLIDFSGSGSFDNDVAYGGNPTMH